MRYANAGHVPSYQRSGSEVVELRASGMPLGLMPDLHYEEGEVQISHGESILFYSKGLVEAHNPAREVFGFPRLKTLLAGLPAAADLGYTGVEGIAIVPFRTPPGGRLHDSQTAFNKELSGIRAAAERAVASVKTWRMLSEEGGRYRAPISKYTEMLAAVTGLFFFSKYYDPYE